MNNNFVEIHKGLSVFIRANRFIRYLSGIKYTRAEIHTLIEIAARGESTIKDLTQILNMEQSSISRLVKNLVSENLLFQTSSEEDKRSKIIKLTTNGKNVVKRIDKQAGPKLIERARRLNSKEQEVLINFYENFGKLYKLSISPIRKGENEIRLQERRLTRSLGVLNNNVFNSGLSTPQWSVLFDVYNHEFPLNAKMISKNQGIAPNTLSQALNFLEKEKLIKRNQALLDSRFIEVKITSEGKKKYKEIEEKVCKDLARTLSSYSKKNKEHIVKTFLKYLDVNDLNETIKTKSIFKISKAKSSEITEIRKFAVGQLFKCEISEYTPEVLVSKNSLIYNLKNKDTIFSIVEFQKIKDGKLSLSLLVSKRSLAPAEIVNFMIKVVELIRKNNKIKFIEINFKPAVKTFKKAKLIKGSNLLKL